jgi:hypothetical protein
MRHGTCTACRRSTPLGEMLLLRGALHCGPCVDRIATEAKPPLTGADVKRAVDPTVCAFCKLDNGGVDLASLGGIPACMRCEQNLRTRPFPAWVRASFFALLVLLVFSLWRGSSYFDAGRALIHGERFMERRRYTEAAAELATVLRSAPDCRKAILLKMKADLLRGDLNAAYVAGQQNKDRKFESNALTREVQALVARVGRAMEKAKQAGERVKEKKDEEGARLMAEAAGIYPESEELQSAARLYEAGVAFDRKDYARFLAIAEQEAARTPEKAMAIAVLASALAARYAETGDAALRQRAEETLAHALTLAAASPQDKAQTDEYAERIRHRLATREIIDKEEYDRRYRANSK